MLKRMTFYVALCLLTSCQSAPQFLQPATWVFDMMPEDAPASYQQGWKDGCESGLSSMTNDYYRAFYTYKVDPDMVNDSLYYKAWKDVYTFCRHYSYGLLRDGELRMKLPNAQPDELGSNIFKILEPDTGTLGRGAVGRMW